jgi:hypothetical protein
MCELTLAVSPPPHRRRIGGSRGATQRGVRFDLGGVSQLTFLCQGWILVRSIFIFYFVRLPLCNKYSNYIVTFISIHSVIIYVFFFGACMRRTRLCPLNPGATPSQHHFAAKSAEVGRLDPLLDRVQRKPPHPSFPLLARNFPYTVEALDQGAGEGVGESIHSGIH